MGAEADTLLGDFAKLVQTEDLESAGIREQRARPAHEPVQSAKPPDELVAGTKVEVVGIAENDLGAQFLEQRLRNRFDGRLRTNWHEDGCLYGRMGKDHCAATGGSGGRL